MRTCLETLMAHKDRAAEKRNKFIARCYADSERLTNLLADVSLITQMDEDCSAIAKTDIDLREIIATVCDEFRHEAMNREIDIWNDVSSPLPIMGNASLLSSVFRPTPKIHSR